MPTDIYEDPNCDHRLDLAVVGAQQFVKDHLLTKITRENGSIMIEACSAIKKLYTVPNYERKEKDFG